VNWQHFSAILWLRWRLRVNQLRRGGILNVILLSMLAGAVVLGGIALFFVFFLVGHYPLADTPSKVLLYVWDGLVVAFLFSWVLGLLTELQRAEALSLDKLLHLPVSLTGAFLINYASSLVSVSMILLGPAMVGLALGLILARGPTLLLAIPCLAAFLLMVTAVTYQFQSWLAALMVNKRRRRTVIVFVTMALVLLCQVPNLLNFLRPWQHEQPKDDRVALVAQEQLELAKANARQGTAAEHRQWMQEIRRKYEAKQLEYEAHAEEANRRALEQLEWTVKLINLILPPGWLPLGVQGAAEGDALPALLSTLGMGLIGSASLWRSYRTILRLYTGQYTTGHRTPAAAPAATAPAAVGSAQSGELRPRFVERRLPGLSEHASAITLSMFRALTRAPEVKMLLLSPIILVVIFGGMLLRQPVNIPEAVRPLMAFGGMAMLLLTQVQLVGNQFGFDRSGFRVFVLCAAPRREILLGKNLAVAPFALGLGVVILVLLQVICPMRLDYLLAVMAGILSMFLLFCIVANWMSIFVPTPVASGSLRPKNVKGIALLTHFLFVLLFPMIMALTLVPLGVQVLMDNLGWSHGVPICLLLSLVECVALVYFYRAVLTWQGELLHARELKILEVVTTKVE
jgi:hypothetical protein